MQLTKSVFNSTFFLIFLASVLPGCSDGSQNSEGASRSSVEPSKRSQVEDKDADSTSSKKKKSSSKKSKKSNSEDDEGDEDDDKKTSALPSEKVPEEPTEVVASFFLETVEPAILNECRDCHAPPRDKVATQAPLTVYSSESMYKMLIDGETFEDSTLLRKVMGKTTPVHAGGTLCATTDVSPCSEFGLWWEQIFGTPPSASWGDVIRADKTGLIQGTLKNPEDDNEDVTLEAYLGPASDDNIMASDAKETGRFTLRLDADKIVHAEAVEVHIYAKNGNDLVELGGSPIQVTAYTPQDEAFFDNNVRAGVTQSCDGCHGSTAAEINSYTQIRNMLIANDSNGEWSRSENYLLQKSSGNGVGHQGGSICPGAGVCAQFQDMWDAEFSKD
ncbi:MAG: hypothetical protein AB8C84_03435 [Oligoflexales bacterium]